MTNLTEREPEMRNEEISLSDLIKTLWLDRRLIAAVTGVVTMAAVVVALLLPNVYTGQVVILPPQQQQSTASAMLSQLGGLAGGAGAALGLKSPNEIYVSMIKSRTVAEKLIKQFDLEKLYKATGRDDTIRKLRDITDVSAGKDTLITIKVDDEDPKRAAAMANAYVVALRQVSSTLAIGVTAQRRLYFERQMMSTKEHLTSAEAKLVAVQARTGILQLEAQGKVIIEAVASLRAEIAAKTVLISGMRQGMTEENPEFQREKAALSGLRTQLAQMLGNQSDDDKAFLPRSAAPGAGLEYIRALREVKYNEVLMEMLAKQFEIARLDEANDGSVIQVLDAAVPPERESKPKRMIIIMLSIVLGILFAIFLVFFRVLWLTPNRTARSI
ncbi:GumC family protein [Chitinimonas sp. BJB300]|uniref:GumC family protein n=1 Tax=Chitinimonas sp. BJB300 TaxID=1559339 RepID=UPI000C1201F9|nr:Wzz/FepE/Etk N-terminal domain-containing protein [Chitinimonas sp. BJB300]PHV11150.1 lipopolysaccharide biosynthesis protein [Chitinimonas sp. BJB300]TSJ85566.1 lipopolysaccharide biosynthesis protein [Chitinimonas sp. BJB300]